MRYLYEQVKLFFNQKEKDKYRRALKTLPYLIKINDLKSIESILVECGSYQVQSNFNDMITYFRRNGVDTFKIIELGCFNFASSTLINVLKSSSCSYYGFDNWSLGGAKARVLSEWRASFFKNSNVISGHPVDIKENLRTALTNTDLLIIDGHHSFRAALMDTYCFEFARDRATVFFHDCGLGNRIWGCFWAFYVLLQHDILLPYDNRFDEHLAKIARKERISAKQDYKPEIEYAIGVLNQKQYLLKRDMLSEPEQLWQDVCNRFGFMIADDIDSQSFTYKQLFGMDVP